MKAVFLIAAAIVVAGCTKATEQETSAPAASNETSAEAGASPAAPSAPAANVNYTAGQNLVTLKDKAQCRETGPNAGEPWELKQGANVAFVAIEGSELRVDSGGGIECLVAPDAVGPA